jgi:type II secretory pathway pseudopilin PulG
MPIALGLTRCIRRVCLRVRLCIVVGVGTQSTSALTLVELLSVIVLIGLIATLITPRWAAHIHGDPLLRARQQILTADAAARAWSRDHSGASLELDSQGWTLRPLRPSYPSMHRRGDDDDAPLPRVSVADGVTCAWQDAQGNRLQRILLDDQGFSIDYDLVMTAIGPDGIPADHSMQVSGISGAVIDLPEPGLASPTGPGRPMGSAGQP